MSNPCVTLTTEELNKLLEDKNRQAQLGLTFAMAVVLAAVGHFTANNSEKIAEVCSDMKEDVSSNNVMGNMSLGIAMALFITAFLSIVSSSESFNKFNSSIPWKILLHLLPLIGISFFAVSDSNSDKLEQDDKDRRMKRYSAMIFGYLCAAVVMPGVLFACKNVLKNEGNKVAVKSFVAAGIALFVTATGATGWASSNKCEAIKEDDDTKGQQTWTAISTIAAALCAVGGIANGALALKNRNNSVTTTPVNKFY